MYESGPLLIFILTKSARKMEKRLSGAAARTGDVDVAPLYDGKYKNSQVLESAFGTLLMQNLLDIKFASGK